MSDISSILPSISSDRMADDLWRLVNIPSPTGQEREAVLAYAEMLRQAGAEVEVDQTLPESPSAIGRLRGRRPGKTLQFAGHIDHIDVPHPEPTRDDSTIAGRGSGDMKAGLAAILEIVRVLSESGADFPGEILVTVYGMHEAPRGDGCVINGLTRRGIAGDAALVMESTHASEGQTVVAGLGQSIWDISLRRRGEVCHELNRQEDADDLLRASLAVARALSSHDQTLSAQEHKFRLLRRESLFVGQFHYGDFYNRVPTTCTLQGTRRWHPDRTFESVQDELARVVDAVPTPDGIEISIDWTFVGDAYEVDPDEAVVRAFQMAHEAVTGRPAPLAGTAVVTDANRLVPIGSVPTVLCGFDNEFAHADCEFVRIDKLLEPCKVSLLAAWNYLTGAGGEA